MKARIKLARISLELLIEFLDWLKQCPIKEYEISLEILTIQRKDC